MAAMGHAHQWGEDKQSPLKLKDQQLEEVESRGSGPNYQSRKRGDGDTEEGWYSVPDVEMEGISKRNLSKTTKLRVLRTLVTPIALYGAETWPATQQDIRNAN